MKYFNYNIFNKQFFLLFLISIFFLNQKTINTQTSDGSFPVGAFMGSEPTEAVKFSYDESGLNTIVWKAYPSNQSYLNKYDVMAFNINSTDWINHYATGCYSKWESEEDQTDLSKIGVKHRLTNGNLVGSPANFDGVQCWSTIGLNGPADSLIYGPHYFQAKKYRRVYGQNEGVIQFIARYNMALAYNLQEVNPSDPVCKMKVVYRYYINDKDNPSNSRYEEIILQEKNLAVSDFPSDNSFTHFNFNSSYEYDVSVFPPKEIGIYSQPSSNNIEISDWLSDTGIQFCIDWLGNNSLYTLYVDYAEVYDNYGWNDYIEDIATVDTRIFNYTQNFSSWDNIKYWYAHDEPHSIDAFVPIKTVDEIVRNAGGAPLITHFFEVNVYKNGEYIYEHFYNAVLPEKLMFDAYPFHTNPLEGHDFASLPLKLQQSYELQPGFYYVPQAFGLIYSSGQGWYKPSNAELNASVMLALAHGSKGIFFSDYFSYESEYGFVNAIVDGQGNKSYLWYHIHDNLAPRLTDKLGNTLLKLDYTGNYLQLRYITPTKNPLPNAQANDYLTIGLELTAHDMNWHVGFFDKPDHIDNKYFLMANLWTNSQESIQVKVTPPVPGYINYRFRNVETENNFDITFTNQTIQTLTFPAGEGYLFQVAPVVKYGGKLLVSETVTNGTTLYEDMTIENGATLTVNGTYYAKANITVKSGGKIVAGTNGKIVFDAGKKLIVDGVVEILGTSANNNLTITAGSEQAVFIKSGSALTVNYCTINAQHSGIETEPGSQSYVNISNTTIYAVRTGISLVGSTEINSPLTTSPSRIYKCNITTDRFYGISVAIYSSILIKENTLNNCGISISNVASAFIQSNNISLLTGAANQPGIFFNNSGGYIRTNTIKNMANGIHLANSSPDIGGNILEDNYLHGLYIGSGSFPNMVGLVQTNPFAYYPLAGYNIIRNNGTDTRTGGDNDGSEIYFSYSDAHLGTLRNPGCNQISDDRTSTSTMNTTLLLGGFYGNEPHFLNAIYNYWGTTTPTNNRFGIAVYYTPYYSSMCSPNGGSAEGKLVLKTSTGEVVDTISSAEGVPENPTALAVSYSEADFYLAEGNLTEAKPIYEQITQGNYTSVEKLPAYNKLYTIANLTGEDENYFNSLQYALNDIASTETDTLLKKIYNQNAIKCDVSKEEYITAINKFDNIIQEDPNSEEAVYAEIDIITTALNLDTTNAQLGKIGGGKYLVKGTSDYLTKLNDILQSRFGVNTEEKEKIIPKEYSLYQNYPNPFNPSTTIKYDLPKSSTISLIVYDVLGRKVKELVNTKQEAGEYEVQFDASNLSSGVYIYKLQAGDFVSSSKMMLVK